MSRMIKTAIAAIVIAASLTPAALAKPGQAPISIEVDYRDLDMTTFEGGQTLLSRIKSAARKSCTNFAHRPHAEIVKIRKCRLSATEAAVRSVNLDTLTLAWGGKAPALTFASR